jgi:hypothetical protein
MDSNPNGDEQEDDDDEDETNDLELKATKILFDSIDEYPGNEENIERFCLPLFSKAKSDYAVDHVKDAFSKRPAMSQIFASYLANFISEASVQSFLLELAQDAVLVDWQKMWVVAALSQMKKAPDAHVKIIWAILKDATRHDALRAVAAVHVGRFGDHARRKALRELYPSLSHYAQAAAYFSSRHWPQVERTNAKATWGHQTPLNVLMTHALVNK